MAKFDIRTLKKEEIRVRIDEVKQTRLQVNSQNVYAAGIVLYKDARCDQRILDEIFDHRWKRQHEIIGGNNYCTVSYYDDEIKEWISKQDVGTEQNFEEEKSAASDAFKRACTNLGIGRELYTTPKEMLIYLKDDGRETYVSKNTGKITASKDIKLYVGDIQYNENKEITKLVVVDDKGYCRYQFPYLPEGVKAPQQTA